MELQERVYSVLIVSASEKFQSGLRSLLPESAYSPVATAASVGAAERARNGQDFDFVFVNSPLPDDAGIRFAIDCCRAGGTVVLLFAAAALYDSIQSRVEKHGVFVLPRPVPRDAILRGLNWMAAARERLRSYEKKVQPVEEKMEEIRLVNRAKWLLISELKMSEPDAHHYITHQAMDRCCSKRTVAEEIIRLYT
ncbi:MAG: ANTAR domain-containing protein [Lawsonibacter sp.]|nr:ANTAR domain-containing protein [Lawsonibacter sp.]